MNTTVKKIESPIQFWSMLGPLFVILTMCVVVIRSSSGQWGLPLVALSGILICYQWKWRGFAVACVSVVAVAVYHVLSIQADDLIWTCLLTLSILSSFLVTVLFLDESQGVLDVISGQSASYSEHLSLLEEKLVASQNKLEIERQVLTSRIEPLKRELSEREEKLQSYEKLVSIVREELMSAHTRQEKLLQELFDSRQVSATLEQRNERLQDQVSQQLLAANETVQLEFNETLSLRESEIADLKARLEFSLEEERIARHQSENYLMELIDLREHQQLETNTSNVAQEDKMIQQAVIGELNEQVEALSREKQLLESILTSLQKDVESLAHQNLEATQINEIHLATIKSLKTSLDAREEELKIIKSKSEEQQRNFGYRERSLQMQIDDLMKKLSSSIQQLEESQRKLHDFSILNDKFSLLQSQLQDHISEKRRLLLEMENARQAINIAENMRSISEDREKVLNAHLSELKSKFEQASEVIAANSHLSNSLAIAQRENQILQQELATTKDQIDSICKQQETSIGEPIENSTNENCELEKCREIRRLDGLYQQLRGQFSEKSKVLDQTRRDLFCAQEELSSLQKDFEELEVYGNDDKDEILYCILGSIEKELTSQINEQQYEISQLHSLIEALLSPKSESIMKTMSNNN